MTDQPKEEKLIRTIIRFKNSDDDFVYIVIPGWNQHEVIKLPISFIPEFILDQLIPEFRCHAVVNFATINREFIDFKSWDLKK